MNLIRAAHEAIAITKEKKYIAGSREIQLPDLDYTAAEVITPDAGKALLGEELHIPENSPMCRIEVTAEDSFGAASRFDKVYIFNKQEVK